MKKHTTTIACLLCALIIGSATIHSCQWLGTSETGGNRGAGASAATQTAATASETSAASAASSASITGTTDAVGGSDANSTSDNHSNTELLSLPEGLPFAALPQQQLPLAGLSSATSGEVANCPLPLADYCSQLSYKATDYSMQWQGETQLTLPQAAEQLLKALAIDGWVLEEAGFIDLYGDAWSCLASRQTTELDGEAFGEVLTVTVMPRQKYEAISTTNPMVVSVVYMTTDSMTTDSIKD